MPKDKKRHPIYDEVATDDEYDVAGVDDFLDAAEDILDELGDSDDSGPGKVTKRK